MSGELFATLAGLAGLAGFGAGFIGLGGGILLFPLLLYLPPYLGLDAIDAKTVAALVIAQVFFAGGIGGFAHWRKGRVHKKLAGVGALASAVGSFFGGVASKWVSEWHLLLLFGIITIIAGAVMFLPGPTAAREQAEVDSVTIPVFSLTLISSVVGIVVGLLGAGNFLFVPLLIFVLKIPTRITIGSSLVIYLVNGFAGVVGKLIAGQVPSLMTVAVLIGAGLGAVLGEKCHSRASPKVLRYAYAGVIAIVALRIWTTLIWP